jgi:alkylated DNA repair dioxygenase AlkB
MEDIFSNTTSNNFININIPDGDVSICLNLFSAQESDKFFEVLKNEIDWKQEQINFFGKTHDIPRLTAWYGDLGKSYSYAGISVEPSSWTDTLLQIKEKIESVSNVKFNSVLLNRYRSGNDGVSWHSDDEPELGVNPIIGSVSFGQSRPFHLKHKDLEGVKEKVTLEHGSYLLMKGETQHKWLHQIPKSKKEMGERINLTFRIIQ